MSGRCSGWRRALATAALAALLATLAQAQSQPAALDFVLPSDQQLDALLAARDWPALGAALSPSTHGDALEHAMEWLRSRLTAGGGTMLGFFYARDLWGVGSAQKDDDPATDMRITAVAVVLYTYELIAIDGTKCEDRTAPSHRLDQLLRDEGAALAFMKTKPPELKEKVVGIAMALEKETAPFRGEDDLLCRDGREEMQALIEEGAKDAATAPTENVSKTGAAAPPAGWTPKLVGPEVYQPLQEMVRVELPMRLAALIQ